MVSLDREILVETKGLKKYFHKRQSFLAKSVFKQDDIVIRSVDGVDLQVYKGETLGLVGESGCGKTTLGRSIIRLYDPSAGEIYFEGEKVSSLEEKELKEYRQKAQIIFQNPYASLNPRLTVRQILSVPLSIRGVKGYKEKESEILDLLVRVGLSERHIDSYPHQFSGGQRQRIGIARALAMHPSFIVADEPVSSLDVSIQAQIIDLLEGLQDEFKLTYLFIAHDLSVIYYISDRIAVMYLGKVVELADSDELFSNPRHPYTKALLSAIPVVSGQKKERIILEGTVPSPINPPRGCRFHTRCPVKKGRICETDEPIWLDAGGGHHVACHLYA